MFEPESVAQARIRREHRVGGGPIRAGAARDEAVDQRELVGRPVCQQPGRHVDVAVQRRQGVRCRAVGSPATDVGAVRHEQGRHENVPAAGRDVERRLAGRTPCEVRVGAVLDEPAWPRRVGRPCHHVDQRRHACGNAVHVQSETVQQLESGQVASAPGDVRRHAVGRVRARLEQHGGQGHVPNRAQAGPERGPRQLRMPVPVILGVGVGAQGAQQARDGHQPVEAARIVGVQARVARVEQRLPLLRSAGLGGQLRAVAEPRLDSRRIAQDERGLKRGRGNAGIEREQPVRATGAAARGAADELVHRRVERHRARLDLLPECVPREKPVLAGDHRLRVVERQARDVEIGDRRLRKGRQLHESAERRRIVRLRRVQERLGLLLQIVQMWTVRELAGHTTSMLLSLWFANRQHGSAGNTMGRTISGLGPSREPAGALTRSSTR